MSYAEDYNYDLDPEFLGLFDYNMDSASNEVEFISIPAWRMRDGTLIAIQDMDTSHIKNCIKMIYRSNGTWRHQYLRYFELELLKRKFISSPSEVIYIDCDIDDF